ncbi:tetratricopeptide repeat-containing sensor histidine kinase [Fibrella arboris]|uniref:tetratricopeptide repeat-containing sensor histidine kinase n=1 Tax=Fibrella arboris TaxID=3242486 RepID=UPI0035225745
MKKYLLLCCLLAQTALAQTYEIDSLKRVLGTLQQRPGGLARDTLVFKTLKAVMNGYIDANVDSSMHYATLAIALCNKPTLQKELIYAYQFAGFLHQIKGDHYQSIQVHYKALLLAERLKQYTRIAMSQGALAHAYSSLKDYAKAEKFCQQGLAVLRTHPDRYVELGILNSLIPAYREQGKLASALRVCSELYELAKRERDGWYQAQALHHMGRIYRKMGDLPKTLAYYQQALVQSQGTGSVDLEGSILLNITELYTDQKKWSLALAYCQRAKQKAVQVNNSSVVVEAEELFYRIYKNTGEQAKALASFENATFLKDSLSRERTQQRIEALQAQYDNVQKENAIQKQQVQLLAQQNQNQQLAQTRNGLFAGIAVALLCLGLLLWNNRRLQAKNHEINRQRALLETTQQQLADINRTLEKRVDERTAELVGANRELIQKNEEIKSALFKGQTIERKRVAIELHDNLSSLLSAVNMSIQYINPQHLSASEQSVYQNVKQLIQNAYVEVRNISHNILPAELEKLGLASTLTTLVGQLNQNSPLQFVLTIIGLVERLPVEIEFNVYSIVLELINNAIKHAKARSVTIELVRTETGIDLAVDDDGVGLGQSLDKRGIGLQNIQARLDSLGGAFNTLHPAETGTRIRLKIPIETVLSDGNFRDTVK